MKKLIVAIITLALVLTLAGCKRTNDSKTLKIVKHSGSTYRIEVLDDTYEFGTVYINVEDEKLVSFEIDANDGYTYSNDSYIKVGSYYDDFTLTEDGSKYTLTLPYALNLIVSTDDDGIETANDNDVKLYAKFLDSESSSSSTTLTVDCQELVEFIRNKALKTE